jgi:hypothetical protein
MSDWKISILSLCSNEHSYGRFEQKQRTLLGEPLACRLFLLSLTFSCFAVYLFRLIGPGLRLLICFISLRSFLKEIKQTRVFVLFYHLDRYVFTKCSIIVMTTTQHDVLQFPATTNSNIVDAQTCELQASLEKLITVSWNNLRKLCNFCLSNLFCRINVTKCTLHEICRLVWETDYRFTYIFYIIHKCYS